MKILFRAYSLTLLLNHKTKEFLMKRHILLTSTSLVFSSLALANPFDGSYSFSIESYPLDTVIWATTTIPVCWEDVTINPTLQLAVENAVNNTWELNSQIDFAGWGQCTTGSSGVRIGVADVATMGPHTMGMGNDIDGYPNGMMLNFTYANWGTSCATTVTFCTTVIAIHEFGHVLGFAHEQFRPDTPATCTPPPGGTGGNVIFTDWDLASVMNYCNPSWSGNGTLSPIDIMTVQTYYGNVPIYYENTNRLEIPNISVGSTSYSAILDFDSSTNNFTLTSTAAAIASSQPASYNASTNNIEIPFFKVVNSGNHVTSLYAATLNYNSSTNRYTVTSTTQLQPTPTAAPIP
jgi:hypothetical protein